MMRLVRSSTQSLLKLVNSLIGMVGMAMILFSIWVIRVSGDFPFQGSHHADSWFIYSVLGLGVSLCLVTCSGHVAAATANGCCLYLYMAFLLLLLMLEAGVITDVLLNRNWEKDFPVDPTGSFNKLKDFIGLNLGVCKWIGLCVVFIQGLCVVLAMLLKAIGVGPYVYYESDDDFDPERMPLLHNPTYVLGSKRMPEKSEKSLDDGDQGLVCHACLLPS